MKVTSLNANIENTTISVNGTAEAGMLAAQVVVYDESGENVIAMQSTDVKADNTFSTTISVASATAKYVVKVADYDGGEYSVVTVSAVAEETPAATEATAGSPETGYQTITKTPDTTVEPSTNASSSVSIFAALAAALVTAAVVAIVIRAKKRQS